MNTDILDKFSQHLRNVLARAVDRAFELHLKEITPLHVLWSLSEEQTSVAAKVLHKHKVTAEVIKAAVQPTQTHSSTELFWPEFTLGAKQLLEKAALLALNKKHPFIGTEHALEGLLEINDPEVTSLLKAQGIQLQNLKQQLENLLRSTSRLSEVVAPMQTVAADPLEPQATPALDHFGVNLSAPATAKGFTHVIGRKKEIDRLMHVLARRTKNNPLLLGDPGVGKTAIVEGLGKRIAAGQVPPFLKGRRLVALDMGLLVAGSMYRGEFEGRLKQVVDEVKQHPEVILFIDEIHTLVGAGGVGANTLDAANILKPALARGDLHCIGATTYTEFQKYFESDPALARRFQPVTVSEPTEEEAVVMLKGIKKFYETFHHVRLSDQALEQAVRLSNRYITDRFLPDKAIDVIDEAAAQLRLASPTHPLLQTIQKLEQDLLRARTSKTDMVKQEEFEQAINLKKVEHCLLQELRGAKKDLAKLVPEAVVTEANVAEVVARMTGVPLEALTTDERVSLTKLETQLNATVVGQTDVVRQVAACIKRSRVGLQAASRPLGSFLFLGPSGVGKTELARQLARLVFGSDEALVKIDMSEFNESFTVSKLIGAPAGYVGFKEGGKLTDQVRKRPYSVVLFDEVEKAHPDIFNLLLQVLDEGKLTDSAGRQINFRNTVIILTSNIGLDQFNRASAMGFGSPAERQAGAREFTEVSQSIRGELKDVFRQEFLNRLDQILVFRPLDEAALSKIILLRFADLARRVKAQGILLRLSASAKQWLAKEAVQPEQGARLVNQLLQQHTEHALADLMLEEKAVDGDTVSVNVVKNKIVLAVKERKTARLYCVPIR
ncbi:MAG: ATP-dependent Clp protease ATP-binding subunit [Patescibacteria group bacterium]